MARMHSFQSGKVKGSTSCMNSPYKDPIRLCLHTRHYIFGDLIQYEPAQRGGSSQLIFRMTLAGFPATMALGGTSLVTTLPAPIMAFSPTVIPHNNVALEPMEAPRFTTVGTHAQSVSVCNRPSALVARGNRSLINVTL